MWENIQTYQENGFLNNNLDNAEDLAEIYKLNDSDVVNVPLIQQRNLHKYNLDDSESDSEETIHSEVLSNDLEKNNACCAAFTVVFLIILYFFEFFLMCVYMISSDRHNQGQMIAQGLCKNFPTWQFMENMTDSWCDPRIFDRDFRLDLQCPCFVPEMFRNMTVY